LIKTLNGFLATIEGIVKVEYFELTYKNNSFYNNKDTFYRKNREDIWHKLDSWNGRISSREDVAKANVQELKEKDISWCERQIKEHTERLSKLKKVQKQERK
jgi:phage pi2 protein 07